MARPATALPAPDVPGGDPPGAPAHRPGAARAAVAVVALLGGVVLLVAGAALAARHLAANGLTLPGVAGLLALVAGVALVVWGVVALLGPRRWWGRLLGGAGLLVVLAVTAMVVAPSVVATVVPRLPPGSATPADRGLAFEEVRMRSADGVTLAGWYVPSRNGAAVVLRHGAGSTKDDTLDQLAVLAQAGYGVLATDARGHGDSRGRAMDFGWHGDEDIAAALDLLAARPDVDPARLGVVGLSMGGEEAVGARTADPRVRAVVAEGVTGRVAADKAWYSDAYGWRGAVQERIEGVQTWLTDRLSDASPPRSLRAAVQAPDRAPVLLVAAGDLDEEVRTAAWLREAAPAVVSTWVVDGAGHTGGVRVAPEAWRDQVVGFLDQALAAS